MKKIFLGITITLLLFLTSGCKKTIIGKWKYVDENNEYFYIFNEDKTCAYEMTVARLGCTYEENDQTITILFDGTDQPKTYEYYFEGKTLIIKDDNGNDNKFIEYKK